MSDEPIKIDPKKQFSKKLAKWTAIFWFLFMSWLSVLFLLVPEAALYSVYMAIVATVVMIVNVWAYTHNSVYEKMCFAMLDKAKIEIGLKSAGNPSSQKEDSSDEESDLNDSEGADNG